MSLQDITKQIEVDLGVSVEIEQIADLGFKENVPDATQKFWVKARNGQRFVLLVSGVGNPLLMARAVENIRVARASLPSNLATHILEPVATGENDFLSYALWQYKRPFPSKGRWQKFVARRRYSAPVLDWIVSMSRETLQDADPDTFSKSLEVICEDDRFTADMQRDASLAIDRIRAGIFRPRHCLQHGDLWSGNILLPTKPEEPPFYIIDWGGMQLHGTPFVDSPRLLISMQSNARLSASHIEALRNEIACDPEDIISYTLSGLGCIGKNLEHFPPDRYRKMAIMVYKFMKNQRIVS